MKTRSLIHADFSIWLWEMNPCIEESRSITGGTIIRKSWKIRLGRYPVITWLTIFLQTKKEEERLRDFCSWFNWDKEQGVVTYIFSMLLRKGNHVSNWWRLARPWTNTTGITYRIIRATKATNTTTLEIHLLTNDAVKNGQWTSWGSGAGSVSHCVGSMPCWMFVAIAAPCLVLKETKAAGTS